jgi:hypothetical protein
MIPMRMADQDVAAQSFGAAGHQLLAQRVSTGSAINNNKCSSCRPDLDARGISPVASRARSGLCYRTASPPELYPHVASTKPIQAAVALASRTAIRVAPSGADDLGGADVPRQLALELNCQSEDVKSYRHSKRDRGKG